MTGRPVNKVAIAGNFSEVADDYDVWATAQAEIARGLVRRLPDALAPGLIVELGCGTGLLSALLVERFPDAALVGLDLAEGMIDACRRRWKGIDRIRFIVGDAEDAAQIRAGAALVVSSCTTQWFDRPVETLRRWIDAMAPGGVLACAALLVGSFIELEAAYRRATGLAFPGLPLWDAETAPRVAAGVGLRVRCLQEEAVTARFESPRAALRSFRRIGATLRGQPDYRPLDVATMRRLLHCYAAAENAAVTYRVQYLVAEKV